MFRCQLQHHSHSRFTHQSNSLQGTIQRFSLRARLSHYRMRANPVTAVQVFKSFALILDNAVCIPVIADCSRRGSVVGQALLLHNSGGGGVVVVAVVVIMFRLRVVQGAVKQQGEQQEAEPHAPCQDDRYPVQSVQPSNTDCLECQPSWDAGEEERQPRVRPTDVTGAGAVGLSVPEGSPCSSKSKRTRKDHEPLEGGAHTVVARSLPIGLVVNFLVKNDGRDADQRRCHRKGQQRQGR